ncbi:MAG: helix-turn-helix domain-containing protein [Opitutaceae bacterium]
MKNATSSELSYDRSDIDANSLIALFSALGDVYFFMKDTQGRFLGGNQLQLDKLGLKTEQELIGKTDFDFFPSYMISHYAEDDAKVIQTGQPILRRVELVANPDGSVSWHITSKFPLHNKNGECIGIVGCMRDFERSDDAWQPYRRMNAAVEHISQHYDDPIEIAELAKVASLSVSQFERRFRTVFEQTPTRFIIRYRLTRASQLLMHSDDTISQIAQNVGFYDHSHFTREFQKLFGRAPGRYRREHESAQSDTE